MAQHSGIKFVKARHDVQRPGGKGKRRPLRGSALVDKAREVLNEWAQLSPDTHPLTLARLSRKLRVSRQALYSHGMDRELDRYKSLQHKQSPGPTQLPNRKSAEQRIADLTNQLISLQQKLDGWIEKWVGVEYNARMLGIDPDQIFAPAPGPQRAGVGRSTRRR